MISSRNRQVFAAAAFIFVVCGKSWISCTGTAEPEKSSASSGSVFEFTSNNGRLINLMIHAFYKDRGIYSRELISNANDALEFAKYNYLKDSNYLDIIPEEGQTEKLRIVISVDENAGTISIRDTGIGMGREELITHLGTIAKSGTTEQLLSKLEEAKNNVIGQFGVGFYSAFMVADDVTVYSKADGKEQYIWNCKSESHFTVKKDPRGDTLGRGTEIVLHLKDDARKEYLSEKSITDLVKENCGFIKYPIYLKRTVVKTTEVPDEEATEKADKADQADAAENLQQPVQEDKVEEADAEKEEEKKKTKTRTVSETVIEYVRLNEKKPIWKEDPKKVAPEEYADFYKALVGADKESGKLLRWNHFAISGSEVDFRAIVFVPEETKHNPQDPSDNRHEHCVRLYVRNVFVPVKFDWPRFLGFVDVVVESDDLPLNISREALQSTKAIRTITTKLISKTLDTLRDLAAEDPEKYDVFWGKFGRSIKLGIMDKDHPSLLSRLLKLLRFRTSRDESKWTSLDAIIQNKDDQDSIFYMGGSSIDEIKASPYVEKILERGYELIYMIDTLDEYMMQNVTEYGEKKFKNITKENFKVGDEAEDKQQESLKTEFEPLIKFFSGLFSEKIEKTVISNRLVKSSCVIVAKEYDMSSNMKRINRIVNGGNDPMAMFWSMMKPTLEINAGHSIMRALLEKIKVNPDDEDAKAAARVIVQGAMLSSGYDVSGFAESLELLVGSALNVPEDAKAELQKRAASKASTSSSSAGKMPNITVPEEDGNATEDETEDESAFAAATAKAATFEEPKMAVEEAVSQAEGLLNEDVEEKLDL